MEAFTFTNTTTRAGSDSAGCPSSTKPAPLLDMDMVDITPQEYPNSVAPSGDAGLTSPPRMARTSLVQRQGRQEDAQWGHDRPPMSVVVVSASSATEDLRLGQSSSSSSSPASTLSSKQESRMSSLGSPFSAPFRLQPRSVLALSATTPGGRGEAARGRKRSAQSMSTVGRDSSLLTAKPLPIPHPRQDQPQSQAPAKRDNGCDGDIFSGGFTSAVSPPKVVVQPAYRGTPPRGKRSLNSTLANFQCLSLQSPKRNDLLASSPLCVGSTTRCVLPDAPTATGSLPPSSSTSSSTPSSPGKRPAMVANSVGSFHSQATPSSNTMPPRSSFTPVYSAASPGGCSMRSYGSGSIGSNTRMNARARASFSPNGGSNKSSPKIASLTVLQDRGAKVLPTRESNPRLPSLPGGGMNSLWLSLDSASDSENSETYSLSPQKDDYRMWPPMTVHCRKTSSDSISTVQNSVLSPFAGNNMMSPQGGSSPASIAAASAKPCTPRSRQARPLVNQFVSPRAPRTPQTPLPRVTLTPRSATSRRSGQHGNHLPRFPSPSDVDMDVTSPFLSSAATSSLRGVSGTARPENSGPAHDRNSFAAIQSLFPGSSNSLALSEEGSASEDKEGTPSEVAGRKKALLPVLDLSMKMDEDGARAESPVIRSFSGGAFMGIQTSSLLTSSRSGGVLQSMMEEEGRKAGSDLGSVSDIDEDEGFILAAPSAIEEERFARCQPARQRRRRSIDRFSNASPNTSNTNLAGMNYVTSNTSLFGMDIAHPADASGAIGSEFRTHPDFAATHGSTFAVSSAKEASTAGVFQTHNRRKSDNSLSSIGLALEGNGGDGGRDLMTPPPMPTPQTPPVLSPKEGCFLPVMENGKVVEGHRSNQTNVCIAGADKLSVTMAIAKMAFEAQHHSESSPVL